jgi:SAM-dependent methyltransferase
MALRDLLYSSYFQLERRIAPEVRYAQSHYEEMLDRHVEVGARWLDVGCGRRLLPPWSESREKELVARCALLVGIDQDFSSLLDNRTARPCFGAIGQLPFAAGAFSLVTANMVVEHLGAPDEEFAEVHRVLAPNGVFLLHTPNAAAYPTTIARRLPDAAKRLLALTLDGRSGGDVFPTYYRANTGSALEGLARRTGFELAELRYVSTSAVFALVPPVAVAELLWLRRLASQDRAEARSNIIAAFIKR